MENSFKSRLFLTSFLALLLEMLIIRWISCEINIFAYLQNSVLVVCFLAMGLGCLTAKRQPNLEQTSLFLLILASMLALPAGKEFGRSLSRMLGTATDILVWSEDVPNEKRDLLLFSLFGFLGAFVVITIIWLAFLPIGRILGRLFSESTNPLSAYGVNIAASFLGLLAFVTAGVIGLPPVAWFLPVTIVLWLLMPHYSNRVRLGRAAALILLPVAWVAGNEPGSIELRWSPYQKLSMWYSHAFDPLEGFKPKLVAVNNTGYQMIFDLRPESLKQRTDIEMPQAIGLTQYDIPELLNPAAQDVLIVGAGTGNDAAGALRNGAQKVTAIDIDPTIVELGKKYHPENPYGSPKVDVIINDARSFFLQTDKRFDIISFGLLDSHTHGAMTNARLDHYVYTIESLERARQLLKPHGIITLTFEAQKPFIADRIYRGLEQIFGNPPLAFRIPMTKLGWGGVFFAAGDRSTIEASLKSNQPLAQLIAEYQKKDPLEFPGTTRMVSDDWPYIYLEYPAIPFLYYGLAILLIMPFFVFRSIFGTNLPLKVNSIEEWVFFYFGAAFMLLEVQNISKAAVVLGSTWMVNAVIISGVLLMVFLANYTVMKLGRINVGLVFSILIASCLGLYFLDLSRLAFLPIIQRSILTGILTTLPMFFSGLLFSYFFALANDKSRVMGANLIGSLVGALFQSITFISGIKFLLLLVAALYSAAWLCSRRKQEKAA